MAAFKPFEHKDRPIEDQYMSWDEMTKAPFDKDEIKRQLAVVRRMDSQRQQTINWLNPPPNPLPKRGGLVWLYLVK